jgi:flavin-dependent dehydrogenase
VSAWDAEVLVVGAGPAGTVTAALLAAAGRDVLVLDKAAFPREKPCAEYLSPGVVDVLEQVGALERVYAQPLARPVGIRIHRGDETFLVSYDEGRRRALAVARPLLDAALLNHARAAGARFRRAQVTGALVEDGRVVGARLRGDGGRGRLRARVVVGADGLHSTIARSLGLDRPARWPKRLGLVARYELDAGLGPVAEMHVADRAYCGLARVADDRVTVSLVVPLGAKPAHEATSAFFERQLGSLPGAAAVLAPGTRVGAIRGAAPLARRVRRVAGRGYLLVGDAAGFLDPFTGEGVYRAVRGAEVAAEAAERALGRRDAFPVGYAKARRAAFADKERVCLLIQAFLASGRPLEYALRRLRERPATARLLSAVLGDYGSARPAATAAHLFALLRP